MAGRRPLLTSPGWMAWAGLPLGGLAWLIHHQLGSDLNFARCDRAGGAVIVAIGGACLLVAATGGALSGIAWRRTGGLKGGSEPAGRFVAALGMLAACLFGLTILVQSAAGLIVPTCWR